MKFNTDREWLKRSAEREENSYVSVGGLITNLSEDLEPASRQAMRSALQRLLELARRDRQLTLQQFADEAHIGLEEAWGLEHDERYTPPPRVVFQIAQFLGVAQEKLMALSGHVRLKDARFQTEALRFAACSGSVEKLRPEEHEELHEFVKFLSER